jgi:hypothetical protein
MTWSDITDTTYLNHCTCPNEVVVTVASATSHTVMYFQLIASTYQLVKVAVVVSRNTRHYIPLTELQQNLRVD